MIPNNSPWIAQLNRTRPAVSLGEHVSTDVAIVGGGIAGVSTAYFILKHTNKKVLLLEGDKIAHGATGHNAGQVTSYFERPFYTMVDEFGLTMAAQGQHAVESAWNLLQDMLGHAMLKTPLYVFTGYAGYTSLEQLLVEFKNNLCRIQAGLPAEHILVSEESGIARAVPSMYKGLFAVVPQQEILSLLETENESYIACTAQKKGCLNSALFTEELITFLAANYTDRFNFFEESKVSRVVLKKESGILEVDAHRIAARHIILCTNGFENFHIVNESGPEIEAIFHHTVRGRIGYMAGYIEKSKNPPTALSYYAKNVDSSIDPTGEPYFYLTRRPFEYEKREHRLVCIGGPEKVLPNEAIYSREDAGSEEIQWKDEAFLHDTYRSYPKNSVDYSFFWHGLMGYTPNLIRRIGHEPLNRVLLYNLGCNGVGILPSVYGGKRISQLLAGMRLDPSIFDPQDQRKFKTMLFKIKKYFKRTKTRSH